MLWRLAGALVCFVRRVMLRPPLRRHAVQLLNQIRGELTLREQLVVPPLMVEAPEPPPRAAKPLPPRVAALVTHTNLR
jgi:hypothetical protein